MACDLLNEPDWDHCKIALEIDPCGAGCEKLQHATCRHKYLNYTNAEIAIKELEEPV